MGKTTHGCTKTRLYHIWRSMCQRCEYQRHERYADYGGRGITVCREWRDSFSVFRGWALANGYRDDLTIDRIEANGNYEPGNCRWVTRADQNRNKRDSRLVTYNGETRTIKEWSRIVGVNYTTLLYRLDNGWDVETAFIAPVKGGVRNA